MGHSSSSNIFILWFFSRKFFWYKTKKRNEFPTFLDHCQTRKNLRDPILVEINWYFNSIIKLSTNYIDHEPRYRLEFHLEQNLIFHFTNKEFENICRFKAFFVCYCQSARIFTFDDILWATAHRPTYHFSLQIINFPDIDFYKKKI